MSNQRITEIAERHGLSEDGVCALADAVERGHGRSAQFSHPDLGGSGQWMAGGMTQIGDMGNHDLKAKVAAAAADLAASAGSDGGSQGGARDSRDDYQARHRHPDGADGAGTSGGSNDWWPADLGSPASSGGQNDSAYAIFPDQHRLAVKTRDGVRVFDTGNRKITGVSQQQGSVDDTRWSTPDGDVTLQDLHEL